MELNVEIVDLLTELQSKYISYGEHNYRVLESYYNETTKSLKVIFEKDEKYRIIVKYVQRNYQRYPIYSNYKHKYTKINKTLKINSENLENLKESEDELFAQFPYKILLLLNKEELLPSWAWVDIYNHKRLKELSPYYDEMNLARSEHNATRSKINRLININNNAILFLKKQLTKPTKKRKRLLKWLDKIKWKFLHNFCKKKLDKVVIKIDEINSGIKKLENDNETHKNNIIESEKEQNKKLYQAGKKCKKINEHYDNKINEVKALSSSIFEETKKNDFMPINKIEMLNYEKIIGVYVIKNNEKEKYYVGQSKDVMKRLKQHFKNNVPSNIIFAEDYYTSASKENLFSVKIIPLSTKDELDNMEKSLIEKYDSFRNGYNKTSGNY